MINTSLLPRQQTTLRDPAVQTVDVDSRFRGNDDVGRARREYRHSRESGNPQSQRRQTQK